MAITNLELARRAIILLSTGAPSPVPWLDMEGEAGLAIPYAMHRIAESVAMDRERFAILTQAYSVTITSGIGNPLTATGGITSAADILWSSIPKSQVKDADGNRLVYVPYQMDFEGYLLPGFKYYTLIAERIYVRSAVTGDYTSDLGDVTSPVVITANFIPTVSSLPVELEDEAVQTLAQVLVEKFAPATK